MTFSGRALAVIVAVIVAVAIVAGLWVTGSPAQARLRRLDERRVNDLQVAGRAIDQFRREHGHLPLTMDSLPSPLAEGQTLRDPASGTPYEYRPSGDSTYSLCADFTGPAEADSRSGYDLTWAHPAGHHCFPRTASLSR